MLTVVARGTLGIAPFPIAPHVETQLKESYSNRAQLTCTSLAWLIAI